MSIPTCIETTTGRYFDFLAPEASDVDVEDIARALANTCRFAGHVSGFYSVAEHAVLVHDIVREGGDHELALAALHHDSHEAYLGDVPTPLKQVLGPVYGDLRTQADYAIAEYLGINEDEFADPIIKDADYLALRLETAVLKHSKGIGQHWGETEVQWGRGRVQLLSPHEAEQLFLDTHAEVATISR